MSGGYCIPGRSLFELILFQLIGVARSRCRAIRDVVCVPVGADGRYWTLMDGVYRLKVPRRCPLPRQACLSLITSVLRLDNADAEPALPTMIHLLTRIPTSTKLSSLRKEEEYERVC